ncbi:prepilin-type N-terminal cleavage/methylation domain-containing protein [Candidatus Oleimmundimicrobium sp.]|uniref:competence type IV pilus major pilin ComGC n=1 Tax=Candidatus Oleimmundimicrobium sp. TaxID=3060597 RepID=UPI0027290821|nr:prepilin-type N-terminal cleavage/methylation domain-containing protein [Candidatus Oleimmundimicrobium sp.]MDO8886492.1 prepilin-type N-terminal cleavage/methylation domain-containing protein [Candidatus Oleimmundimicrobium sp.]
MRDKAFMRNLTGKNGFSLVELTIVIFIISVLVSIAVFSFRNTEVIDLRTCQSNLKILDGAIVQYFLNENSYPGGLDELAPKYIKTMPKCPTDKTKSYEYDSEKHEAICPNGHSYP